MQRKPKIKVIKIYFVKVQAVAGDGRVAAAPEVMPETRTQIYILHLIIFQNWGNALRHGRVLCEILRTVYVVVV